MSYWRIAAEAGAQGQQVTLYFYGPISDISLGPDDKTPAQIAEALDAAGTVGKITARINSGGGSFFAGMAIYNLLKSHTAPVDVIIDGLAGSAASFIAMAGDTISMPDGAFYFLHNPMGALFGYAKDLRTFADELDTLRTAMVTIYAKRTGQTAAKIGALLDAETWLTNDEAQAFGFADTLDDGQPVSAYFSASGVTVNGHSFDFAEYGITPPGAATLARLQRGLPAASSGFTRQQLDDIAYRRVINAAKRNSSRR